MQTCDIHVKSVSRGTKTTGVGACGGYFNACCGFRAPDIYQLKIWRGGEFRIVEFQREELVDVEGDPDIQRRLGERIRV